MRFRYELSKLTTLLWPKLANFLPRQLVYFAAIRLIAHGTTGKYGATVVPDLRAMEALKRWGEK